MFSHPSMTPTSPLDKWYMFFLVELFPQLKVAFDASLCVLSFHTFLVASPQPVVNTALMSGGLRAFEQRFVERNTQFCHFLVVTLPKKLLQEKVSVLSVK